MRDAFEVPKRNAEFDPASSHTVVLCSAGVPEQIIFLPVQ